jgi:Protein of unknown function (DUF2690)
MNKKKILILFASIILIAIAIEVTLANKDIGSNPGCQKASCVNLDARDLKCDRNVTTLISEVVEGITIELRYSSSCDTSWTRAFVPTGTILYVQNHNGDKFGQYTVLPDNIMVAHYGNMGVGKELKACAKLPNSKDICTNFPNQVN